MTAVGVALVAVVILAGIAGIVVPVVPGSLLVWGAIAVWAWEARASAAWGAFAIATLVLVVAAVVKFTVPGRRLRQAGIPGRSLLCGTVLGFIGFFVVPVVGLFLGFVLGVHLYELHRNRDRAAAWDSTKRVMRATGLSILIELAGALLATGVWVIGVVLTT